MPDLSYLDVICWLAEMLDAERAKAASEASRLMADHGDAIDRITATADRIAAELHAEVAELRAKLAERSTVTYHAPGGEYRAPMDANAVTSGTFLIAKGPAEAEAEGVPKGATYAGRLATYAGRLVELRTELNDLAAERDTYATEAEELREANTRLTGENNGLALKLVRADRLQARVHELERDLERVVAERAACSRLLTARTAELGELAEASDQAVVQLADLKQRLGHLRAHASQATNLASERLAYDEIVPGIEVASPILVGYWEVLGVDNGGIRLRGLRTDGEPATVTVTPAARLEGVPF